MFLASNLHSSIVTYFDQGVNFFKNEFRRLLVEIWSTNKDIIRRYFVLNQGAIQETKTSDMRGTSLAKKEKIGSHKSVYSQESTPIMRYDHSTHDDSYLSLQ